MITLNSQKNIEYVSSGLFRSNGEWCHPERIIDTYEVIFVVKGEVYISEGEEAYHLSENEILLLAPSVSHKGIRNTEGVSFYWMHFKSSDAPSFKNIKISDSSLLKTMFSSLMHITNTDGYSRDSRDLICALIVEEVLFCSRQREECSSVLVSELREYIRLNIGRGVSVGSVSSHFGYHPNYLGQLFLKITGVGMKEYIAEVKIKKASELLATTLCSVKEISSMLGFHSENHFIKFFKYHTLTTPSKYRSAYANTHINDH